MQILENTGQDNFISRAARSKGPIASFVGGTLNDFRASVHEWGRSQFATSYARGGFARTAFAPTSGASIANQLTPMLPAGSSAHIRNLEKLQQLDPTSKNIAKALKTAKSGTGGMLMSAASRAAGVTFAIGFGVMPLFTTPGGASERLRAGAGGFAGGVGFTGGAWAGAGIGAAAFGAVSGGILAPVGAVVGAIAGGLYGSAAAEGVVEAGFEFADKLVASERKKRHLNWVGDASAFQTRKAHTMRQQSLTAMNRGMMASRSVLGREASFMHM